MIRKFIYGILFLLITITPFICSVTLYNGVISAKQLWFFGVSALTIFVFGIDLLLCKKSFSFSINMIDVSLLAFYAYFLFRVLNTPYTPLLYNTKFLNYTLLIILYFILRCILSRTRYSYKVLLQHIHGTITNTFYISLSEILIILLMLSGLVQAMWGLLQLYGFTRSFHSGFKITGTFINPAPYALYLTAIFPLALGYILIERNNKGNQLRINNLENENLEGGKRSMISSLFLLYNNSLIPALFNIKLRYYISLFTVIAIILVLPATMNRASWIGVVAGSLVVFNYRYNLFKKTKMYFHNTVRKLWAFSIIVILIGILGAGLYFLKKGSSDGRLLIWQVTAGKIVEKPLFGHGVGRFEAEYNNWQAEYFKAHREEMAGIKGMVAGNTKYCFNEYIEMTSELGFTGLLLFFGLIISIIIGSYKRLKSGSTTHKTIIHNRMTSASWRPDDNRITGQTNDSEQTNIENNSFIFLIASLTSILICALFSFPFYSLPSLIFFFVLLSIISSRIRGINIYNTLSKKLIQGFILSSKTISTFSTFSIFSVLTAISLFLFLMANKQNKALRSWDEAVMLYQSGAYVEANINFAENYPLMKYNGGYLQYYGKSLYMYEEYLQSIGILERASLYTSDEMLYTNLGDSYKALKKYPEAEAAYKKAMFMVPHKLYPRYLLAKLYRDAGQKENALRTAHSILKQRIKVESIAIKEIRIEMKGLIKSLDDN